jgi:hypothetical protein
MYNHSIEAVLTALIPFPPFLDELRQPSASVSTLQHDSTALAIHLSVAAAGSHRVLMAHVAHVNELWKDMVSLNYLPQIQTDWGIPPQVALGIYDSATPSTLLRM